MADIELIHMSHFIEAAFGLCIAYTILEDVHQWGQEASEMYRKNKCADWDKLKIRVVSVVEPQSNKDVEKAKSILEKDASDFTEKMRLKISPLKLVSFITGLWFFFLLAYAGSHATKSLSTLDVCFLVYTPAIIPLIFMANTAWDWNNFYKKLIVQANTLDKWTSPPAS